MSSLQVQGQDYTLANTLSSSATSLILSSFTTPDGTPITKALIGDIAYLTIEPETANEENVSIVDIQQNTPSAGQATLIIGIAGSVSGNVAGRGLGFTSPYTSVTALRKTHASGVTARLTNSAPFYTEFAKKGSNETVSGSWNFTQSPSVPTPTTNNQAATKAYVDAAASSGAPDATATNAGLVELATTAEINAGTASGSDGPLTVTPDQLAASKYNDTGQLPTSSQKAALAGTSGAPSATNKYVVEEDVAENTNSKIIRRKSDGNLTVPTTPSANTDAASKSYVDSKSSAFATGTLTIASTDTSKVITHNLNVVPKLVRITGVHTAATEGTSNTTTGVSRGVGTDVGVTLSFAIGTGQRSAVPNNALAVTQSLNGTSGDGYTVTLSALSTTTATLAIAHSGFGSNNLILLYEIYG